VASSEQDRRLRPELAEGLGFYPASLAPEDVARYREQIAERKAREEAGERDGWGPGGYKWRKWDHLRERFRPGAAQRWPTYTSEPRQRGRPALRVNPSDGSVASGREEVADLYE
jgi:hypothetical protein